jgi:hypothetical protein
MASLTESSLSLHVKPHNDCEDIYLCIQKSNYSSPIIDGFKCYKFSNFNDVDNYYNKNRELYNQRRHALISINKWVPFIFHRAYLNYQLNSLFWKNDISIQIRKKN